MKHNNQNGSLNKLLKKTSIPMVKYSKSFKFFSFILIILLFQIIFFIIYGLIEWGFQKAWSAKDYLIGFKNFFNYSFNSFAGIASSMVLSQYLNFIIRSYSYKRKSHKISNLLIKEEIVKLFNLYNKQSELELTKIESKTPMFIPTISNQYDVHNLEKNDERLFYTIFYFKWKGLEFSISFNGISYINNQIKVWYNIEDLNKNKIPIIEQEKENFKIAEFISDEWIVLDDLKPFVDNKENDRRIFKIAGFDAVGDDFYISSRKFKEYQKDQFKYMYKIPGVWFFSKNFMTEFDIFFKIKVLYELDLICEIMNFNYGSQLNLIEEKIKNEKK